MSIASPASADELTFNLHLIIHDYGRVVATALACKSTADLQTFRQDILDVASTNPSIDSDALSKRMDASVQKQSLRVPGCSDAAVNITQRNFDRDLKDFKYAVENN